MLARFISNLSFRFRSENDLSDVTWTMCQTSDRFQCVFLKFFFPWLADDCAKVNIEREPANNDSRPDFVFDFDGKTYLIENKIGDKNHHFEQYVKAYKIEPSQLGYIANYPIKKEGFNTRTWKELYLHLKDNIPVDEQPLWDAYLEYVKDVCYIYLPTKPMNLNGMTSLYTFYRGLDDVFAINRVEFESSLYDSRKDTKGGGNNYGSPRDGIMGKYFELKFKGIRINKTWGWMGVYFEREDPLTCIGFRYEEGWGKPVYSFLSQQEEGIPKGKLSTAPYEEDGAYWFDFKVPKNFDTISLDKQMKLLKDFFEEVVLSIYNAKKSC